MKAHEAFPSIWLTAADLLTKDGASTEVVVTIKAVKSHTHEDGKQQRTLSFEETSRQLGLNKTNWNAIARITGRDDDDDWLGARIELYRTMVEFKGEMVPAVRVRPVGGWEGFKDPSGAKKDTDDLPF